LTAALAAHWPTANIEYHSQSGVFATRGELKKRKLRWSNNWVAQHVP